MGSLKGYRSKAKGLPDLLPYAALVAPGIILNKDGSLLAAWEFRGADTTSSTVDDLNFVAVRFNHASIETGTGLTLHVDAVRKPTSNYPEQPSFFPDRITQLLEDERKNFFENGRRCYETTTVLSVTYKSNDPELKRGNFDRALAEFQEKLEKLEIVFGTIPGFRMQRLLEYESTLETGEKQQFSTLFSFIHHCITGDFHPMAVPVVPMYLDAILGGMDFTGGRQPKIGKKHIKVLSLDTLPGYSYPAMLKFLDRLAISYRFSTRFICLDTPDAEKEIKFHQKGWNQVAVRWIDKYFNNPNPKINYDAMMMVEDAEIARLDLVSGNVRSGYLTMVVVLLDEDEEVLKENVKLLTGEFNILGFVVREEDYNAQAAWEGSLPGNVDANERKPMVNTINLAHLLPLASIWPGEESCPCPFYPPNSPPLMMCTTNGSTPFRLNIHVGDVGHTLIVGPTGSGKSAFLALILAQFRRYKNAEVIAFDRKHSLLALTKAVGGEHLDLGDGSLMLAPFQWIDESAAEFSWTLTWLEKIFVLQGLTLKPDHMNALNDALKQLCNVPKSMRNMTHLLLLLQNPELKMALEFYTEKGTCGQIWESSEDSFQLSNFMVFEMESLSGMGEKILIPVLDYIFHSIKRTRTGNPTLLAVDEAYAQIKHKVFLDLIVESTKEFRKLNAAMVFSMQSLTDAEKSGFMDVFIESCKTVIYLPNHSATQAYHRPHYENCGLNIREIELIANAYPKQDYYVTSPAGRRLVQLAIGRKTLAFVGASSPEDVKRVRELIEQHGQNWPYEWLQERKAI